MISLEPETLETEPKAPATAEPQPQPAPETSRAQPLTVPDLGAARSEAAPQLPPSELAFACVLLPRFPDHHLAGDIANYLPEWLGQICISYGWRLDAIVVRPGYLHWLMTTPLTVNPAQLMRVIQRRTSERIFEEFPRFKRQNMSGDFWAPGYYINTGKQLLTPEIINEFTLATRQQQGIF